MALASAVARPRWLPESVAAAGGALVLIAGGAIDGARAWHAVREVAPALVVLAALLLVAEGGRRDGLFDAIGHAIAQGTAGRPTRLLAAVFAAATAITAVLGLDATVVLLTPIVFATATRLRVSPRPHVYASAHLANSASLLLPISNLTNLLAYHASGLSFLRFAACMALPTASVVAVEWLLLRHRFAGALGHAVAGVEVEREPRRLPVLAPAVIVATLVGFALSSVAGIDPAWVAVAAAVAINAPALARRSTSAVELARAVEPGFLIFVAGLAVIVAAAADHGLRSATAGLMPAGTSLGALLADAAIAGVLANLVNNLPATLILLPVATAAGPAALLAVLIGVNVGPNLTYAGSLATLLWRRILHRADADVALSEYLGLGALTVPSGMLLATVALWLSTRGLT